MLLMGITVLRVTDEEVELSMSLPPGFDVERLDGRSLLVNDEVPASGWLCEPKRSRPSDLFRAFRAVFPRERIASLVSRDGGSALRVTGSLLGGARVEGVVAVPEPLRTGPSPASASD